MFLTIYGLYNLPPLTAADTARTCWIGVTDIPWPKEVVASSTLPILLISNIIPFSSPFKSISVLSPIPKFLIYSNNLSLPSFRPKLTKPGFVLVKTRTQTLN